MTLYIPEGYLTPAGACAVIGRTVYGEQWRGCLAPGGAVDQRNAIDRFRQQKVAARKRDRWADQRRASPVLKRRRRQFLDMGLSDDEIAQRLAHLDQSDLDAIEKEVETRYVDEIARERQYFDTRKRLLELLRVDQVTAILVDHDGREHNVPVELWRSDSWVDVLHALETGEAEFDATLYRAADLGSHNTPLRGGRQRGRLFIAAVDLTSALEVPSGATHSTTRAEKQCQAWLEDLRSGPKEKKRDDYMLEAIHKFGSDRLSKRGFSRAWTKAREGVPNSEWERSGPLKSAKGS